MSKLLKRKIGFGTAPLGNMYRNIPEEEAIATVDAAWDNGVRYFAAPLYGSGLARNSSWRSTIKRNRDDYF